MFTKVYFYRFFENNTAFIHPSNPPDADFQRACKYCITFNRFPGYLKAQGYIEVDIAEFDANDCTPGTEGVENEDA